MLHYETITENQSVQASSTRREYFVISLLESSSTDAWRLVDSASDRTDLGLQKSVRIFFCGQIEFEHKRQHPVTGVALHPHVSSSCFHGTLTVEVGLIEDCSSSVIDLFLVARVASVSDATYFMISMLSC